MVITFIDIDVRERAELESIAAKAYTENVFQSLHEPLVTTTPNLEVLSANLAFYRHFNADPAQTIGLKIYDLGNHP